MIQQFKERPTRPGHFVALVARLEQVRERLYLPVFQSTGMSLDEAEWEFWDLVAKANEFSRKIRGVDIHAETLPELTRSDPKVPVNLEKKTAEGVREEDTRWWWDMSDVERERVMVIDDRSDHRPVPP